MWRFNHISAAQPCDEIERGSCLTCECYVICFKVTVFWNVTLCRLVDGWIVLGTVLFPCSEQNSAPSREEQWMMQEWKSLWVNKYETVDPLTVLLSVEKGRVRARKVGKRGFHNYILKMEMAFFFKHWYWYLPNCNVSCQKTGHNGFHCENFRTCWML
jgi:hypothetical protein